MSAFVSGALAAGTLTGAPTANATCASFFGINNGGGCTSTPLSIAIGIGNGAVANAAGLFGAAFSVGNAATASTADAFTFATALGNKATATAKGLFGIATQVGTGLSSTDGSGGVGNVGLNIALTVSAPNNTAPLNGAIAGGFGNIAVNLLGTASPQNYVFAQGIADVGLSVGGYTTGVIAGPGPFATAVSFLQTNTLVKKKGPGFNINGVIVVGGAAAVGSPKTSAPTATAVHTATKTAAAATATHTHTQKTAPAATATSRAKR